MSLRFVNLTASLLGLLLLISTTVRSAQSVAPQWVYHNDPTIVFGALTEVRPQPASDTRVAIDRTDPRFIQLNAVGAVYSNYSSHYEGTGFIVQKPCAVLTNVHVVFEDPKTSRHGEHLQFSVGQTGDVSAPFALDKIDGVVVAHGNYDGASATVSGDWVLARLAHSVPRSVASALPICQVDLPELSKLKLLFPGYPSAKTWTGKSFDLSSLYGDMNCNILDEEPVDGFVIHNCQSTSGNSGSPLLAQTRGGKYCAVGMAADHTSSGLEHSRTASYGNFGIGFYKKSPSDADSQGNIIQSALDAIKCD